MSSRDLVMSAAGASTPSDPRFNNVSLLLTGDGTNGAQNNTFLDSSSNNFTITRNGNTTQGTFSPYGNLWSNYFDGSGDYLVSPTSSEWGFNTGDFTLECWVNLNSVATVQALVSNYSGSSWSLQWRSDTAAWAFNYGNSPLISYTNTPNIGAWNHIAVTRSGTSLRMFLNGTQVASVTDSTNITSSSSQVYIGSLVSGIQYTNGYISNVRVVKGTAVYTSSFTPSTTPLTAVSGTLLLTCQSNRFIDNSSNNFTLTVNGNTSVQRFSPFNPTAPYSAATIGGSGYFDGTGDYLTTSGAGSFNASSGDWTVEAWLYCTNSANNDTLLVGNTSNFYCTWVGTAFYLGDGVDNILAGVGTKPTNQWFHFAAVKNGSTYTAYYNGVSIGSSTTSLSNTTLSTWQIGYYSGSSGYMKGYISGLRVLKGTALYTTNFTPPTTPPTAIANTNLLTNFTNAGIPDAAMMNDLETVGNAQVSTSVKKYGTGSLYFDGTGDWLTTPSNSTLTMGTGDFTAELWVYPTTTATSYQAILDNSWDASSTAWQITLVSGGYIALYNANGASATLTLTTSTTISANTWSHIAVVKSGTTVTIYINGVSGASGTMNVTFGRDAINYIGCQAGNAYPFNGYIDDLRVTKGYARYTTNFTPPTAALPTY